jgi:hypothetical protein
MRYAAIGVAKPDVFRRALKGLADRIVVGDSQSRRLVPVDQQ